jgi:arylsulfatase A-like enzyme
MKTKHCWVLLLMGMVCWAGAARAEDAPAERRPNVVVILADDLGCGDMSLYDGWIKTPRLDRMAREGVFFTDFHTNSSVCSPTRTAFLTGRYQQRYGLVDVIVGSRDGRGLSPEVSTLPRVFKDAGYATALFGKWHLGYQDQYNPVHHGFDEFIGFLTGGADYHRKGGWRNGVAKAEGIEGYGTHVITDMSVDFIKRNKDKPFFLYVSHQAVHNPYQTPADTPESRDPDWKHHATNDINRPRYKVILEELDKGVGKILDTLAELELDENTLVFFFSDNGSVRMNPKPEARPYRGGKFSQYEGGHRVPAIAWWPGKIKAGGKSDALVMGFDLLPTFTDIAGISGGNPKKLDGISVKGHLLEGDALPKRDVFFGYEPKLGTAMRRGNWKMIVKGEDVQLFDLNKDIKETTNIAAEQPEIAKEMREAIEGFKKTVVKGS